MRAAGSHTKLEVGHWGLANSAMGYSPYSQLALKVRNRLLDWPYFNEIKGPSVGKVARKIGQLTVRSGKRKRERQLSQSEDEVVLLVDVENYTEVKFNRQGRKRETGERVGDVSWESS